MNPSSSSVGRSIVTLGIGLVVGASLFNAPTTAQQGVAPVVNAPVGRYQVSAYAAATPSIAQGCYIVDTSTGSIWHAREGGGVTRIAESLP